MEALLAPAVVQTVGAVIVAALLLQAEFAFLGSLQRLAYERRHQRLAIDAMVHRVAAESAHSRVAYERAALSWGGTRKFRVAQRVEEGGDICSFHLVAHDGKALPPFHPGQYLTFSLPVPGQAKPVIRCYSLSDSPLERDHYRVSVKRIPPPRDKPEAPPGLSSSYFHDHVREGDILDVKAPNGHFFLDTAKNTPLVLVGGGVGITPVLSMLNNICVSGSRRETWFFYGVRNRAEHIMKDHLEQLARSHENVHLQVCYSDPTDNDVAGRDYQHAEWVGVDLFKRLLPSNNYEFYICGPPPMMSALTEGLADWGVPSAEVHFEAFGPASVKSAKAPAAAEGADAPTFEILFAKAGKTVPWDPGAGSLLEFAEANDVVIDSGCRAGNCGTCTTAIRAGEVSYVNDPGAPPDAGSCLTCIAVPKTDLTLEA